MPRRRISGGSSPEVGYTFAVTVEGPDADTVEDAVEAGADAVEDVLEDADTGGSTDDDGDDADE